MKFDPFFSPEDSGNNTVFKLSDIDPVDLASGGWDSHMRFVPSQMRVRTWISIWTALYQDLSGLQALEIGVFRGDFLREMVAESNSTIRVKSWTGVDPYLGTKEDPYLGSSYWRDEEGANLVCLGTRDFFDSVNQRLIRLKSADFFQQSSDLFDLIYVDGDHRFEAAILDFECSWRALKPGGLLMLDDYGNPDTPEVTRATNEFIRDLACDLDFGVFFGSIFRNSAKHFPVISFQIGLKKK